MICQSHVSPWQPGHPNRRFVQKQGLLEICVWQLAPAAEGVEMNMLGSLGSWKRLTMTCQKGYEATFSLMQAILGSKLRLLPLEMLGIPKCCLLQ